MLVCLSSFMSLAQGDDDYGDDNDDGVTTTTQSQGRGMSACVFVFPGCIHMKLIAKFGGIRQAS